MSDYSTSCNESGILPIPALSTLNTSDSLILSHNVISLSHLSLIIDFLPRNIKFLELSNCSLNDESITLLAKSFTKFFPNLTSLVLDDNNISHIGVVALVDSFFLLPAISHLSLASNPIRDTGLSHISDCLGCIDLEYLNLSNCELTDVFIEEFTCSLVESNVKSLLLSNNNLGDTGLVALSCLISVSSKLTHLEINYVNASSREAFDHFITVLGSSSLKKLAMKGNRMSSTVLCEVCKAVCSSTLEHVELLGEEDFSEIHPQLSVVVRSLQNVGFTLDNFGFVIE
ncbi:hypothetical protein RCL1_007178 [Eukaryota sp. TZLM3-RCL]